MRVPVFERDKLTIPRINNVTINKVKSNDANFPVVPDLNLRMGDLTSMNMYQMLQALELPYLVFISYSMSRQH